MYKKRGSTLLVVRKTQIKTSKRCHLYMWRRLLTKGERQRCWWGCGERQGYTLSVAMESAQPWWETVRKCLKKWKTELLHDTEFPTTAVNLKGAKIHVSKRCLSLLVHCGIVIIAKITEKSITNKWMRKMSHTHAHVRTITIVHALNGRKFCHLQQYGRNRSI